MYVDIYKGRVYAPDDYTILVDTLDARVSYAGIVAEKYNTIPHIIFFSNKPIPEFSESDEERIYELCATINSDVEKIHNNEVNAIIKDGKIMNEKEYVLSKRLGIFAIPDVKNKENLYLNFISDFCLIA